ncbi:MAG TPA: hypothetical protein VMW56_06370 [Candidatus Margulisiibacteriota bacterium]|nr:hypothetical protein [Candidatus Margulisiibacteriota bacterium]
MISAGEINVNKTFIFVHGTGVRTDDYRRSLMLVKQAVESVWPASTVLPCSWGEKVGAKLACGGVSIPDFSGETPLTNEMKALAVLWELLATDADFEWLELAGAPAPAGFVTEAMKDAHQRFPQRLAALGQLPAAVAQLPDEVERDAEWRAACETAAAAPALGSALAQLKKIDARVRRAGARACVAHWLQHRASARLPLWPAEARDALVDTLFAELGGADAGKVTDWVKGRFVHAAKRWATDKARRERDVLFNATYPIAGDILMYQARGDAIRAEISYAIRHAGDEVVVLAHSLGGIACVDLLVDQPHRNVKTLVTFGSQAPLLYELGALRSLPLSQPLPPTHERLPAHFPAEWINVYDRDDLLSYKAAPIFKPRVRDLQVRSGVPFPDSHSAYWTQPAMWQELKQRLA